MFPMEEDIGHNERRICDQSQKIENGETFPGKAGAPICVGF